jgi:hypothetical protein
VVDDGPVRLPEELDLSNVWHAPAIAVLLHRVAALVYRATVGHLVEHVAPEWDGHGLNTSPVIT